MPQEYNSAVDPPCRVYPYGTKATKTHKWLNVKTPNDAWKLAVDSIPDKTFRMKGKDVQDFLVESFSSMPSKFPLLILTGIFGELIVLNNCEQKMLFRPLISTQFQLLDCLMVKTINYF